MNLSQKPSQLKILGRNIPVNYLSPLEINAVAKDDDILGYYCGTAQAIYINNTLEGKRLEETLIHEIVHAILNFSGLTQMMPEGLEEAVCNAMEGLVYLHE